MHARGEPFLPFLQLPYTGLTDEPAKNLMYGFALFFGGLVSCGVGVVGGTRSRHWAGA